MAIKIDRIDAGSEAEALGLQPGDELLSVDENELNDTLDYDFYTDSSSFHLKAKVADGIREWDVRRAERGPFGCDFSTYLGDQKHSCSNHCMFCFIDQLPPGMRESLYFKDDDERLSFLFGNYITMTNMQDHEIDRIIKMHISPINISVHTTNPQLRVRMLANKRGGEVLKYLPRLVEGGIAVNCQLVLCRGINDGEELRRTLGDLLELTPMVQSIAAVPCGVTDYRQNLFKQTPYDAETSAAVIDIMEEFGDECKRRHGKRIIYPSDEWYLKAGRPIPEPEFYEDYDQLENGVGMMRLYASEFLAELEKPHRIYGTKKMDVVTGEMASPLIRQMMAELHRQYPMITVHVHTIQNRFFGGNVGVTGLITATDIIAQCAGKLATKTLGIPAVMLREEKDTFLDDITVEQLGQQLGVKVEVLPTAGGDEARALLRSADAQRQRRLPPCGRAAASAGGGTGGHQVHHLPHQGGAERRQQVSIRAFRRLPRAQRRGFIDTITDPLTRLDQGVTTVKDNLDANGKPNGTTTRGPMGPLVNVCPTGREGKRHPACIKEDW